MGVPSPLLPEPLPLWRKPVSTGKSSCNKGTGHTCPALRADAQGRVPGSRPKASLNTAAQAAHSPGVTEAGDRPWPQGPAGTAASPPSSPQLSTDLQHPGAGATVGRAQEAPQLHAWKGAVQARELHVRGYGGCSLAGGTLRAPDRLASIPSFCRAGLQGCRAPPSQSPSPQSRLPGWWAVLEAPRAESQAVGRCGQANARDGSQGARWHSPDQPPASRAECPGRPWPLRCLAVWPCLEVRWSMPVTTQPCGSRAFPVRTEWTTLRHLLPLEHPSPKVRTRWAACGRDCPEWLDLLG